MTKLAQYSLVAVIVIMGIYIFDLRDRNQVLIERNREYIQQRDDALVIDDCIEKASAYYEEQLSNYCGGVNCLAPQLQRETWAETQKLLVEKCHD